MNSIKNQPLLPLIIGHRGSSIKNHYPENTIPAFREAIQLGADGIELDIQLSGDGQLMVYAHDGFWQCVDTYRELDMLNKTWKSGEISWKSW